MKFLFQFDPEHRRWEVEVGLSKFNMTPDEFLVFAMKLKDIEVPADKLLRLEIGGSVVELNKMQTTRLKDYVETLKVSYFKSLGKRATCVF